MEVKGVIFDCDGVIVDSELIFTQSVVNYLKDKGIEKTIEEVTFLVGQNTDKITSDVIKTFGISDDYDVVKADLSRYFKDIFKFENMKPMDGLVDFLNTLDERGIKKMIASSSGKDYLNEMITSFNFEGRFTYVLSGEDFKRGKPEPDIYIKAIEMMGLDKNNLAVIEDSVNGIKAAKAAGLYTIGYKGSRVKQDTSLADEEVNKFTEISFMKG